MGLRARRWLLVVGLVVAAVGVLAVTSGSSDLARCAGGAEAALLPTTSELPDVVGSDVAAARAALESAGVPAATVRERWVVDERERGLVLASAGGGCGRAARLTVSTGGPLVDPDEPPDGVRRALGEDPGPVRQVTVGRSQVWQSGTVIAGACADVARAVSSEEQLDPVETAGLARRCLPDPDAAVLAALTHGARTADVALYEVHRCGPGSRCTVWTADRGWALEVSVRTTDDPTLRCGPVAPLEVCVVRERPGGGLARTLQRLGESPPGSPYVAREVVVVQSPWSAELTLQPDRAGGNGRDRTAPPLDAAELVEIGEDALRGVADVTPP